MEVPLWPKQTRPSPLFPKRLGCTRLYLPHPSSALLWSVSLGFLLANPVGQEIYLKLASTRDYDVTPRDQVKTSTLWGDLMLDSCRPIFHKKVRTGLVSKATGSEKELEKERNGNEREGTERKRKQGKDRTGTGKRKEGTRTTVICYGDNSGASVTTGTKKDEAHFTSCNFRFLDFSFFFEPFSCACRQWKFYSTGC